MGVSGRPRVYGERVHTVIRIPTQLHARLREAADDRDVSVNWLVLRALEDFLDRLIPADELRLTRPREAPDGD